MYARSDPQTADEASLSEPLQLSAVLGYAALIFSEAGHIGHGPVDGTVAARIEESDRGYYPAGSEMLTRGAPLTVKQARTDRSPPQLRAKDLIAELNIINSQIHQIMFQVERAVARLGPKG